MAQQPPDAFCLCTCQANIQAVLRPGAWIPGVRSLHQYVEDWLVPAGPQVTVDQVVGAVKLLNDRSDSHGKILLINRVESNSLTGFVRILALTKKRWLSVIELDVLAAPEEGCYVTARAFSTGLLPVIVPACYLWNCILFFVPFYDAGRNADWLLRLREAINVDVYVQSAGRKC